MPQCNTSDLDVKTENISHYYVHNTALILYVFKASLYKYTLLEPTTH